MINHTIPSQTISGLANQMKPSYHPNDKEQSHDKNKSAKKREESLQKERKTFEVLEKKQKGQVKEYRITGYFRSRNFRRTFDKLNFEGFIFELVAEFENILTRAILYAP